jgi:hypothetical protein
LRVIIFVAQQLPSGPGTPHCRASRSLSETAHSVGLPWTSDQPEAQASTLHHNTLTRERERGRDTHAPGGIRTRNPTNIQTAASSLLRTRSDWDQPFDMIIGSVNTVVKRYSNKVTQNSDRAKCV